MMTVSSRSAVSGTVNTMEVNLTNAQLIDFGNGHPLAEVAPHLTTVERRFLETSVTPEEDAAHAAEGREPCVPFTPCVTLEPLEPLKP